MRRPRLAMISLIVALTACGGAPASTSVGVAASPRDTPLATSSEVITGPSSAGGQSPVPSPETGLSGCPATRRLAGVGSFRSFGLGRPPIAPDDLLALADGTVWVTDPDGGVILHLGASGEVLQRLDDPNGPEGMALLPDGRLILAEQKPNRIVWFRPTTTRTTMLTLPPRGNQLGLDGITLDSAGGRLLVPDSPHGTLLALPVAGAGPVLTLASGLGRDVGVAVGSDGSIWVAVEGPRGLVHLPRDGGAATPTATLSQLDDLVFDRGLLYATDLAANDVVAIDPATGADRVLITGAGSPQGLAVLPDGRLIVADSAAHAIAVFAGCR